MCRIQVSQFKATAHTAETGNKNMMFALIADPERARRATAVLSLLRQALMHGPTQEANEWL